MVRQAHGPEQSRRIHHPEPSRRAISKFEFPMIQTDLDFNSLVFEIWDLGKNVFEKKDL